MAAALAARAALAVVAAARLPPETAFWTADTARYLELASHLLEGHFATGAGPEVYRVPGYPLLLAVAAVTGVPTAAALALQALTCWALVVLVIDIARRAGLADETARLAGFACALEPTLLLWSLHMMPDALLALAVGGALWALPDNAGDSRSRGWVMASLAAAGAALVKPVAYGLVAVLAILAAGGARRAGGRAVARAVLAATLPGALVLGLWHTRNAAVAGFPGFSTQFQHLARSTDFAAWRAENPTAERLLRQREKRERGLDQPALPRPGRDPAVRASYLRVMLRGLPRTVANPGVVSWLQFLGIERGGYAVHQELFRKGPAGFLRDSIEARPAVLAATGLLGLPVIALWAGVLAGFVTARLRNPGIAFAAASFIGYFLLASGGVWGQSRARVAFIVPACVLVAFALAPRAAKSG